MLIGLAFTFSLSEIIGISPNRVVVNTQCDVCVVISHKALSAYKMGSVLSSPHTHTSQFGEVLPTRGIPSTGQNNIKPMEGIRGGENESGGG